MSMTNIALVISCVLIAILMIILYAEFQSEEVIMSKYQKKCEQYERRIAYWKHKSAILQGKLTRMEDDVKGWEETQKSLFAVVTGVIAGVGADEDHPVKVSREAINDALEGKTQVIVGYDAETGEYTLFAKRTEKKV